MEIVYDKSYNGENGSGVAGTSMGDGISPKDKVTGLYVRSFGVDPVVEPIPGAGSDRKYFRLYAPDGPCVIGTWGEDKKENRSFVELSRVFRMLGHPVPMVYSVDFDCGAYLQEDFGSKDLLGALSGDRRIDLAKESLAALVRLQASDMECWESVVAQPEFSSRQIMWDLNYFKYEFLKPSGLLYDEGRLEDDFELLSTKLLDYPESLSGFMYRDFQSRNIMVDVNGVHFIDYQGGRKGPVLYDAVSFLWQAKASFSAEERRMLLDFYYGGMSRCRGISKEDILDRVDVYALFRTLQVLGAYGFRGLVEKRAHFIESIPGALENLRELVERGALDDFPELKRVSKMAVESRFMGVRKEGGLRIKVFSFSYKKGYPEDLTGNGGGFMFDCRGMHNPGRYGEYRALTGRDKEVADFLESRGEVQSFVDNCHKIVAPSVKRYIERGFHDLQIGFGCTGGQHRSVYCAEAMAARLSEEFPEAEVELIHREQGIFEIMKSGL